jgi:membrane associated rhomboid family serine protease
MFPIGDDNSDRRTKPIVNYTIIFINIIVFVLFQGIGSNDAFNSAYSLVPREITTGIDLSGIQIIRDSLGNTARVRMEETPVSVYITLLTSMFMHGGIMHLFGNMLFLWVFGDNIENRLGHVRYAIFYVVCGLIAAAGQIAMDMGSIIPMLGASGAISGVLGGYLLLYPKRRVRAILFNFLTDVPAYVALGSWIVYQIILGYLTPAGTGGVAYAAHIGGFIAGLVLIKIFAIGTNGQQPSISL